MPTLTTEQIRDLADKWLKGTLTADEFRLFEQWYNQQPSGSLSWEKDSREDLLKERLFENITGRMEAVAAPGRADGKRQRMIPWRLVAAACVLLVLSAGALVWSRLSSPAPIAGINSSLPAARAANDPAPGGNRATLILDNGSTISLDSTAAEGILAQQGSTRIMNRASGQLIYHAADDNREGTIFYNTVSTARGGQYQLQLPDGTRVWLNAASSLRFPTAFTGKERVVELKGEAYFEVAKNAALPFRVKINDKAGVEVLGTSFNLNAYEDEQVIRATLLEGSVRMKNGPSAALLAPGQQAQLAGAQEIHITDDVNTDEIVAWKNNRFYFRSADIRTIMRQLSRWYDVDVEYSNGAGGGAKSSPRFNAEIPRNTYASDVLKALELTGKVKFRIEGKKIIVDVK
ncbi:MAG TPA: FecR family protein [Puia sp.]|jgi:ferric-dicitrate binding protein FerR (iron transport regulator)